MAGLLVVSYAEGVAMALVGKLGLLLIDQYTLLLGVRGQIALLRDDVAIMNSLLRMLAEAHDVAVSHFVREWMKQVRELAYDAEDNIDLFLRRIGHKQPSVTWAARCSHWPAKIWARLCLGRDIKDLRARARAISERRVMYGVSREELQASKLFIRSSTEVVTLSAMDDAGSVVGIDKDVDILVAKIVNKLPSEKEIGGTRNSELKVFSIVGFGGAGKTTLANAVYRKVKDKFQRQAKVVVSQAFDASKDMPRVLKQILDQVATTDQEKESLAKLDTMDVAGLISKVESILKNRRYLIVIDDVWTIKAWEAIRARLPENNRKSRVIVTTRIQSVANACIQANPPEFYIHRVNPLGDNDAKDLFNNRVFGRSKTCPPELEEAARLILNKCGGIPLVIISIAGLVANYKSAEGKDMWNRVCKSMGSQMESSPSLEGMRQLITLSYNDLPHHLRACLMYLSIFPEDYHISKDRLLNRWIAEGLIPEKRGLTSLEVAEGFADELVSRNLVEPIVDDTRVVTHYRVHDVMLEVILSKALEENFVTLVGGLGGGTSSYDRVRRLSIQDDDDPRSFVQQKNIRNIRSLTTFRSQGHIKMLDRLKEFTLLRVLDLEDCKELKDHHLKHVCRLFLLRFLNLNDTDIKVLPSKIGDLLHLHTLWLYNTLLEELPGSVTKLENLENLTFYNREETWRIKLRLPQGLKRMKSLTSLTRLELKKEETEIAKEIGHLVQLRKLHMVLDINYHDDRSVLVELGKSISSIPSLRDFSVEDVPEEADNMRFLHGLTTPPLLLRHLTIGGKIDRLPEWMESLTFLTQVWLWWVDLKSDEIFGVLCKVPNLLKIVLERNCCSDKELVADTRFKFKKLRELQVVPYGKQEFKPKALKFGEDSMKSLELLTVKMGQQKYVRNLIGVGNLTGLKTVTLSGDKNDTSLKDTWAQLEEMNNNRTEETKIKIQFDE